MVENFPLRQQNHHHQAILLTHCKMKMKWKSSQEHTFSLIKKIERERKGICKKKWAFLPSCIKAVHSKFKNSAINKFSRFFYSFQWRPSQLSHRHPPSPWQFRFIILGISLPNPHEFILGIKILFPSRTNT